MLAKLLLPIFICVTICNSTNQSYHYYYIELPANPKSDFNGWYHRIVVVDGSITIASIMSNVDNVHSIYQQYNNYNFFVISKSPSTTNHYKWRLIKLVSDRTTLAISPIQEQGSNIQAAHVILSLDWYEIPTLLNQKMSRVALIQLLKSYMQQNKALQPSATNSSININLMFQKLPLETQQSIKKLILSELQLNGTGILSQLNGTMDLINENLIIENERLRKQIKTLMMNGLIIIGIISLICIVVTVLWCNNIQKSKIDRLQQMHQYVNRNKSMERSNALARKKLPQNKIHLIRIKNEGNNTIDRFQPEQFSDMLDNSNKVQDIIVEDIISDMQTEGDNNDEAQNDKRRKDSVVDDGTATGLQ